VFVSQVLSESIISILLSSFGLWQRFSALPSSLVLFEEGKMDIKLLIIFIVLNIFNVIIQTVKSIATVKCDKVVAAIVNAIAYGLYTVVTVFMLCDLPLAWKAFIVAMCNLVGVYAVKALEEKARKDKLWKVEATVSAQYAERLHNELSAVKLSHNYIDKIGKYVIFNVYCETQADSIEAKKLLDYYHAKYFVSESKIL
jgi:hypothetical protein